MFYLSYFRFSNSALFLPIALVLSFFIDIVFTPSIKTNHTPAHQIEGDSTNCAPALSCSTVCPLDCRYLLWNWFHWMDKEPTTCVMGKHIYMYIFVNAGHIWNLTEHRLICHAILIATHLYLFINNIFISDIWKNVSFHILLSLWHMANWLIMLYLSIWL